MSKSKPTYHLVPGGVPGVINGLGPKRIGDVHLCWGGGTLHGGHTSDHFGLLGDDDVEAVSGELFDQAEAFAATVNNYEGPLTLDLCFRANRAWDLTLPSINQMRTLRSNAKVDEGKYPIGTGLWPYFFAVDADRHPKINDLLRKAKDEWNVDGVQWASFPGFESDIPHANMPEAEWASVPGLLAKHGLKLFGVAAFNHISSPHTGETDDAWRTQFSLNLRFTLAAYGQDHTGKKVLRLDGVQDPAVLGRRAGFKPAVAVVSDRTAAFVRWVKNLQWAANEAAKVGVELDYESEPGFVYHTLEEMTALVDCVARPNFKIQLDWSHADHAARGTKAEFA